MEEQILEIMSDEMILVASHPFAKKAAKEINAHVFEFIEWLTDLPKPKVFHWFIHSKWMNIEEIYQYWLTNIKNK